MKGGGWDAPPPRRRRPRPPVPPETQDPPAAAPPADLDVALERWWGELPRSQRRAASSLPPDTALPEDLVVSLLLHGVLTAAELRPAGGVEQRPELRRFLAGKVTPG